MEHSRTAELRSLCLSVEILVAAIGRPNFVQGDWIRVGAIVIDVKMNRTHGVSGKRHLVGDVDHEAAMALVQAVSPCLVGQVR